MSPSDRTRFVGLAVVVLVVAGVATGAYAGIVDTPWTGGSDADGAVEGDRAGSGNETGQEGTGNDVENDTTSDVTRPIDLVVDRSVEPRHPPLLGPDGGEADRPVARVAWPDGGGTDFVENEIVVEGTRADAREIADRYGGAIRDAYDPERIAHEHDPADLVQSDPDETAHPEGPASDPVERGVFLVRVDPAAVDPGTVEGDVEALDATGGTHRVSSPEGLGLLAAALNATRQGYAVEANWVADGAKFEDDSSVEGSNTDVWNWPEYNAGDDPPFGVTEAWKRLEAAGKIADAHGRIRVAVLDGGFAPHDDIRWDARAPKGYWGPRDDMVCGGAPCPYHGTRAGSVAVALADNEFGVAGTGGPVAKPLLIESPLDQFYLAQDVLTAHYYHHANVITNSFSLERGPLAEVFRGRELADATSRVWDDGGIVVTSAGNTDTNVDEKRVAREKRDWMPCENDGVICVGGTDGPSNWRDKHDSSSYGTGSGSNTVDIFAPYRLPVGPIMDNDRNVIANGTKASGTSFSAPYVAGVIALVKSADPSLTPEEIEDVLYETAYDSPDSKVGRIVNPEGAVARALAGDPPTAEIVGPSDGDEFARGAVSVRLDAEVSDPERALETVEWISDREGVLIEEATGRHTFEVYGTHELRVRAVDAGGQETVSDPIEVEVTNQPPEPEILHPADGARVLEGTVSFEGVATDPNEAEAGSYDAERGGYPLAGDDLEWIVTDGDRGTRFGTGEEASTSLRPGTYTVVLRATDGGGETAETSIEVEVVETGEPVVRITDPDDGTVAATEYDADREQSYAEVTLTGEGVDGTGDPMTGEDLAWKRLVVETVECEGGIGGTCFVSFEETVGTGTETTIRLYYDPEASDQTHTIYLEGTDGDETVRDSVELTVVPYVS